MPPPNTRRDSYDYALLQTYDKVKSLARADVIYAGWTTFHDYAKSGYFAIGHPNGDVKTANSWSGSAYVPTTNYFEIKNSTGVFEEGMSGGPVFFSSTEKVVGWLGATDLSTGHCGSGDQRTSCGRLSEIHPTIKYHIDSGNMGVANSANPTGTALPSHCRDCTQNYDEEGIDCGGSCQPCAMADDKMLNSFNGESRLIRARFDLEVNGQSNVVFFDNDLELQAGDNISLKSSKFGAGNTFMATVDPNLKLAPLEGCQEPCVYIPPQMISVNGDGVNDFAVAEMSFVESYDIEIRGRWGNRVYRSFGNDVFETGVISLWDGSGVNNGTYYIYIIAYDCNGSKFYFNGIVSVFGILKSEEMNDYLNVFDLLVFPNPATNEIMLSYNFSDCSEKYIVSIVDLKGGILRSTSSSENYLKLDISNLANGLYVINVDSGKDFYSKTFIKK